MANGPDLLSVIFVVGSIGVSALFGYAIFWALNIRRALRVKLYRNQALGLAFVAATALLFPGPAGYLLLNFGPSLMAVAVIYSPLLLIFYWIDASLRATRRSDPLLRDTLHWEKVRKILWPADILVVGYLFILQSGLIPSENTVLFLVPYLFDIILGVIFLPIVARRSKDRTLRRHFAWFGIFFLALVPVFLAGFTFPNDLQSVLQTFAGLLLGGFALYRGARSLAPLKEPTVVVGTP